VYDFSDIRVLIVDDSADWRTALIEHRPGAIIFGQGDPAETLFHVLKGGVKLSAVSTDGREGVVAILGPGDFFGEGCLLGQTERPGKATATVASTIMSIDKKTMLTMLREQPVLSDRFIAYLLARIRIQEDLVDQIFNSCEKRLARTLLLLACRGQRAGATRTIPKISQATLAAMTGTTRERVNVFMNKFKRLGFIDCTHELKIFDTLQSIVTEPSPNAPEPADHLTRSTVFPCGSPWTKGDPFPRHAAFRRLSPGVPKADTHVVRGVRSVVR
jgi:CRP/FNR family cyclic AMP-dependent transcriptional regulator